MPLRSLLLPLCTALALTLASPSTAMAQRFDDLTGSDMLRPLLLESADLPAGVTAQASAPAAVRLERLTWEGDGAAVTAYGHATFLANPRQAGIFSLVEQRVRVFPTEQGAIEYLTDASRGIDGWGHSAKSAVPVASDEAMPWTAGDESRLFAGGDVTVLRSGRVVMVLETRATTPTAAPKGEAGVTVGKEARKEITRLLALMVKRAKSLPSKAPAGVLTPDDLPRGIAFLASGTLPIAPAEGAAASGSIAIWSTDETREDALECVVMRTLRFATPEAAATGMANRAAWLRTTEILPTPWKGGDEVRVLEGGRLGLVRMGSIMLELSFTYEGARRSKEKEAPLSMAKLKDLAKVVSGAAKRAAAAEAAPKPKK